MRAHDGQEAEKVEFRIDQVANTWDIVSMDARVLCARARLMLMAGQQEALIEDGMIAAVAAVHRRTVVTRDVKDFKLFGIEVLNPFR